VRDLIYDVISYRASSCKLVNGKNLSKR